VRRSSRHSGALGGQGYIDSGYVVLGVTALGLGIDTLVKAESPQPAVITTVVVNIVESKLGQYSKADQG
jgi:hypothetical protein